MKTVKQKAIQPKTAKSVKVLADKPEYVGNSAWWNPLSEALRVHEIDYINSLDR